MLDIVEFCRQLSIPYHEPGQHRHTSEGWIQLCCPFCDSPQDGWHLGFSLEKGNFNCWRCGPQRFWTVVPALAPRVPRPTLSKLIDKCQMDRLAVASKSQKPRPKSPKAPVGVGPLAKPHRKYLKSRGFDPDELVEEWELGGTRHLSGTWSWRIIIPILDANGFVAAYQGRAINNDAEVRYRTTPASECPVDPKDLVYGAHRATSDSVMVVEGPTDVWRLGPGTVATLGQGYTQAQVNVLRKYRRRHIIFDPSDDAQARATRLAMELSIYPGITEVISGQESDPGSLPVSEAKKLRRTLLGA